MKKGMIHRLYCSFTSLEDNKKASKYKQFKATKFFSFEFFIFLFRIIVSVKIEIKEKIFWIVVIIPLSNIPNQEIAQKDIPPPILSPWNLILANRKESGSKKKYGKHSKKKVAMETKIYEAFFDKVE